MSTFTTANNQLYIQTAFIKIISDNGRPSDTLIYSLVNGQWELISNVKKITIELDADSDKDAPRISVEFTSL